MTRVVSTELAELPRLTASEAAVFTQAARALAALPTRLEIEVGELGVVEITCEGVVALDPAGQIEASGDVALGLSRASGTGRLVIDGSLARRLLSAALGVPARPGEPLVRLGLGERGVVAGLAASALSAARAPVSVSLVAPSVAAVAGAGGVGVALALRTAVGAGWLRLELPAAWLPVDARATGAPAALELEARVELARTRLLAPELARVEVGDAIVFDSEPAPEPGLAGRAVRIALGSLSAGARVAADGTLVVEESWRPAPARAAARASSEGVHEEEAIVTIEDGDGSTLEHDAGARTVDLAEVLARMPVEVVAELGRIALRGDEVAALAPGAVLRLGRAAVAPVSLRVADQLWAEGELVAVDGELGVRVTATRGRGLP